MPTYSLDGFERKSFLTNRQYTYTYYTYNTRSDARKPTLLFIHGFPDDAHEWAPIMPQFKALDFPLILVDLLGMDGTSKPTDAAEYASKHVALELGELARAEGVTKLIPIGHDWGSYYAGRVYNWNPQLCVGLVNMSNPYTAPLFDGKFDWEANNKATEARFGGAQYAYWEVFCDPKGPQILHDHIESFFTAMHGKRPMDDLWCHHGAMRDYLLKDQKDDVWEYAKDPAMRDTWIARMRRDGFKAPLNYYHAFKDNHHWATDVTMPRENAIVKVPALFISSTGDHVCRFEYNDTAIGRGLLQDITLRKIEGPHWMLFYDPDSVAQILVDWLKDRF